MDPLCFDLCVVLLCSCLQDPSKSEKLVVEQLFQRDAVIRQSQVKPAA